jgi:hypothetical protein
LNLKCDLLVSNSTVKWVKLCRYPEAILEAFVPLRLKAYEKRRAMLIRQAESELKRMSNKVRFILAVVDGELSIGRGPVQVQCSLPLA